MARRAEVIENSAIAIASSLAPRSDSGAVSIALKLV
jgi:hypothetical protein